MINSDFCWISDGLSTQIRFDSGFTGPRKSIFTNRFQGNGPKRSNTKILDFRAWSKWWQNCKKKLFRNNLIISDWTERGPTNIENHRPGQDQVNSGIGPSLGPSRNLWPGRCLRPGKILIRTHRILKISDQFVPVDLRIWRSMNSWSQELHFAICIVCLVIK